MKTMKLSVAVPALLVLGTLFTQGAIYTFTNYVNQPVPDANPNGMNSTIYVSGLPFQTLDVNVYVNVSGGYNGDLYAYLSFGNGLAVLLNRVGKTGGNPFGYGNAGVNVKLDDDLGTDFHNYGGAGVPTGTYQPDARKVDPLLVTDLSSRTAFLSTFDNADPNGTWTIFFADMAGGFQSTVIGWGLEINAVPEPVPLALAVFGVLAGSIRFARRWKHRRSSALPDSPSRMRR